MSAARAGRVPAVQGQPGSPEQSGSTAGWGVLPREFFDRPVLDIAPDLLGCVLTHRTGEGVVSVEIVEVEAYRGESDPASHAFRGKTVRNAVMYGEPGHAYVYFTYGMHFCVNLVCQPAGQAAAVLLRAGRVIAGTELAVARRLAGSDPGRPPARAVARDLARGPARLCQALAIGRAQNGADVCDPFGPLRVLGRIAEPGGYPGPGLTYATGAVRGVDTVGGDACAGGGAAAVAGRSEGADRGRGGRSIAAGPRVGVRNGARVHWRFWIDGESAVSVYRPHVPRRPDRGLPSEGGRLSGGTA